MAVYDTPLQRENAIRRLVWMARFLDNAITIPGIKFRVGYDGIIGLVPGIGDIVTTGMSLYVVYESHKLGASGVTIAKMLGNVALDFVISEIPGVGDIIDVFFKSNTRNLVLLGKELGIEELARVGTGTVKSVTAANAAASDAGFGTVKPDTAGSGATTVDAAPIDGTPRKHVDNVAMC